MSIYNHVVRQAIHCSVDYSASFLQPLPTFAFDLLCGQGDLLDIVKFIFDDRRPDSSTITRKEYQRLVRRGREGGGRMKKAIMLDCM